MIIKKSKQIFFTSQEELNRSINSFFPYIHNYSIIPYGVLASSQNDDSYKFIEQFPHLKNKKIVLFLGRITEKKCVLELVKAFKRIVIINKKYHLVIAGDYKTKYGKKVLKSVKENNLTQNITFVGFVSESKKRNLFSISEIFILPSKQENYGVAVVESLSYGVPVIITPNVAIHETISYYNVGIIDKNPFRALLKWINLRKDTKLQMKKDSHKCFNKEFNLKTKYLKIIESYKKYV